MFAPPPTNTRIDLLLVAHTDFAYALSLQDNQVDRYEFLTAVLVAQGKISKDDIAAAEQRFTELDTDKNGYLTMHDFKDIEW